MASIASLVSFFADDCPIEDCPADVYLSRSGAELRAFFSRQEALTPKKKSTPKPKTNNRTNDVKLILLGNSNAGKTNLLHYLTTGEYLGDRKSTHGLEVHRWLPDAKRFPLLANVAVSIWDFGGQEYYHGAYRLFMNPDSVYLLLWDKGTNCNGRRDTRLVTGGKEEPLEHFELRYWLDTIRNYGGERDRSLLLIAQNKVDDRLDKKRIPQDLHERYGIRESFHFSLKKGCELKEQHPREAQLLQHFERELEDALASMVPPTPLPEVWQRIRNSILELQAGEGIEKNPFAKHMHEDSCISLEQFEEACATLLGEPLLESERGNILPKILERGGVVVYFENSAQLNNRVFLRPSALADRIYKVLKAEVLSRKGEFELADIIDRKDKEFQQVFIEATQHMGLVFPHPDPERKGAYIAPQYLPAEHPIEDLFKIASHRAWESAFWVKVPLFYYKKLLHGLLLHYAGSGNNKCYFWKHGILFIKDEIPILLKGLYPNEDEKEGTLLVGVESKGDGKQADLQKELFEQIKLILVQRDTPLPAQTAHQARYNKAGKMPTISLQEIHDEIAISETVPQMDKLDWLELSRDGRYFVPYKSLIDQADKNEIKMSAKDKDGNEQPVLIRQFEALLDRKPKRAKRVFVSYSHNNTAWLGRLRAHLSGLRRSNEIEAWDDQEMLPGDEWGKTIKAKLAEADVVILLLSADFIASSYIWDVELKAALEGQKAGKKWLIPILIEPLDLGSLPGVDVQGTKIQDFEIVPKDNDGHLLAVSLWPNHEAALAYVAQRIRAAIVG